jgi:hypothetical protein
MLEGEVDQTAGFVAAMQNAAGRIKELEAELAAAKLETVQAKREAATATAKLRKILKPYYDAMKQVFGELEAIGGADETAATNGKADPRWDSWKKTLPGLPAQFIDLLLEHGEMTSTQLKISAHCGTSTVPQVIHRLNKAGLINKNGGKYSLKTL